MDLGLTDKVYLVTAASSGLGRATAQALVAEGARVVVAARHVDRLDAAVESLGRDRAVGVPVDLAEPDAAGALASAALETYGRLDGAMVSVGGPPAGSVLATPDEAWVDAFGSVFLPALRVSREVLQRGTAEDGIALAWVLSTSVRAPLPHLATSNGLRPGLGMLVKQLADEIGPQGHRVLGLMPGRIDTDRVRHLDEQADDPDAARRAAADGIPLRRYGRPEEFGTVAAFLLSPAASYLTGSVIPIDGGVLRAL